jgi:hypothetical protein
VSRSGPKVAVITGASAGLGEEFARQVDAHPAFSEVQEIWLVARREARLHALAGELSSGRGVAISVDLAERTGVEAVLARARESAAQVRLVINNAGFGLLGRFDGHVPEVLGRMLDLNVRAGTMLLHGLAGHMDAGARVIQVASAAAHVPAPYFAAYAASKSYALALALALREEWRGRISVCAVCPGPVATEFSAVAGGRDATGARAQDVVALALRDALAGRAVSNAGVGPKLVAQLAGVLPRGLLVRLAGRRNLRRART